MCNTFESCSSQTGQRVELFSRASSCLSNWSWNGLIYRYDAKHHSNCCVICDAFASLGTIKCQQNSRHTATINRFKRSQLHEKWRNVYSSCLGLALQLFLSSLINRVTQANQVVTNLPKMTSCRDPWFVILFCLLLGWSHP